MRETIMKDLDVNELDQNMVLDKILWRNLIHVVDLTQWDKTSLLLRVSIDILKHFFVYLVPLLKSDKINSEHVKLILICIVACK